MTTALRRRHGFPHKRRWSKTFVGGEILPVTFPTSPLATRVHVALGADLTASHLSWNWLDVTEYVRHDLGISVTFGRRDERGQVTASRCQLKLENTDGRFTRRNALGPYYGLLTPNTPIWIELDPGSGFRDRYFGFINEWPTRWTDPSGTDCTVTIQCAGVMRRLAQGEMLGSPLRRSISGVAPNDYAPLAYWPMEDASGATQIASGLPGGSPMVTSGTVTFANASDLMGSEPLLTLATVATATADIASYANTGQWVCQFVFKLPAEPAATTDIAEITVAGGFWSKHVVKCTPGAPSFLQVDHYVGASVDSSSSVELDATSEAHIYGHWVMCSVTELTVGSLAEAFGDFIYFVDGSPVAAGVGVLDTGSPGQPTRVQLMGGEGTSFGHLAVFVDANFNYLTDVDRNAAAMTGYDGELAHVRMGRLCHEEGVSFATQASTSAAMGPQETGTLLALLRSCELADQGVLYENQYGLGFQALPQRYNQPVAFDLDFDAGHIAGTPEPADDDQRLVNRFRASRSGGSEATQELDTGTLGTGAGGSGVYGNSAVVNVQSDSQLSDYAGWKVRLGTVDEDRWPQIGFYLHGSPELIPGWLDTPLGSRISIANPPSQISQEIDAVLEGYTERWDTVSWAVALSTSPASPYDVGLAGDSTTAGSWSATGVDTQLAAELASGATSASVTIDGPLFSTSAADLAYAPLSLRLGGEIVPVSAISGGASPQTFTITRTLAKTHPAGTPVEVYHPAVATY